MENGNTGNLKMLLNDEFMRENNLKMNKDEESN
jgi:hypothetical protein